MVLIGHFLLHIVVAVSLQAVLSLLLIMLTVELEGGTDSAH